MANQTQTVKDPAQQDVQGKAQTAGQQQRDQDRQREETQKTLNAANKARVQALRQRLKDAPMEAGFWTVPANPVPLYRQQPNGPLEEMIPYPDKNDRTFVHPETGSMIDLSFQSARVTTYAAEEDLRFFVENERLETDADQPPTQKPSAGT